MDIYQLCFQCIPGIVNLRGLPLKLVVFIGHIHPSQDKLFPLLHLSVMVFHHLGEKIVNVPRQGERALRAVNEIGQAPLADHILGVMEI